MRHVAHIAHHTRGRLRIRVPSAKRDPAALEAIRQSLASLRGVQEVVVNESIGSVTINYDPQHHADFKKNLASENSQQDVVSLEAPKLEELAELDEMIAREAAFLAQHSGTAKTIFDWMNAMDRCVRVATNNAIDFKVLAPLALAVGAFMELGITASTPVWLTLGLFSFNHFIAMHTHATRNDPAVPAQTGAAEGSANGSPRRTT